MAEQRAEYYDRSNQGVVKEFKKAPKNLQQLQHELSLIQLRFTYNKNIYSPNLARFANRQLELNHLFASWHPKSALVTLYCSTVPYSKNLSAAKKTMPIKLEAYFFRSFLVEVQYLQVEANVKRFQQMQKSAFDSK
jgi:hypothetical protein